MSPNFIRYGGEPTEPPNRIYARIDRIELEFSEPSEPITATFDGIDASQFDSLRQNLWIDQARLSVLEVDFFDLSLRHIPAGQEGGEPRDWFEIKITSSRTPIRARQYTNLFGA